MDDAPQKPACAEFAEIDPTGRYGRYDDVLGRGASKTVYRAFDEYEGIEVAWNQVKLYDFLQSPVELERLYCEIHLLKTLEHKNIMKFYTSWVDITKRNINFITEMFTSGTLKQYRQKHKRVNIRAVKHWCRQILSGLLYLHSHDPPIIHRDLKCDNIFINGNQGEVKIGDLGLAAFLRKSHAAHCVGTPEFMAPEVYKEEYNELVDIYSFGMCVLEMVTFEYPYSECTHPVQIYKKVISGTKPEALYKVRDPDVRQFVEKCLATASRRLPAKELLKDPFLQSDDYDPDVREVEASLWQPSCSAHFRNKHIPCGFSSSLPHKLGNRWGYYNLDLVPPGIHLFNFPKDEPLPNVDVTIKGRRRKDGSIYVRLRITDKEGRTRNIYFPFDIEADTALSVADEMVSELDIIDYDVERIAAMIDSEISSLVPGWRRRPGIEDIAGYPTLGICQNCSPDDSFRSLLNYGPGSNNTDGLHCCPLGCAAMHGRFEEFTFHADGSGQCESEEAPAPSSSSEGIDLSLPSTPGSHSDEESAHMDEQARNVGSMIFSSGSKNLGHFCCDSSANQQCSKMLKTSWCSFLPNLSHDQLNGIRQELGWHKGKHQTDLQDYNSHQFEGSRRVLKLPSELDYREHGRKEHSSVRPPQMCTAEPLKSLRMGEKAFSFPHHPPIAGSPANCDGGLNWCSGRPSSVSRSGRHCKVKHQSNPETMFSVKDFYKGILLLNCVPRTKSFPGDVVDA